MLSGLNKKLFVFLVFGVVMILFVGYHLGHKEELQGRIPGIQASIPAQLSVKPEYRGNTVIIRSHNQIKAPRQMARTRLISSKVPVPHSAQNLTARMNHPERSNHQAERKPHSAASWLASAAGNKEASAPLIEGLRSRNHSLPQNVIDRVKMFVFFMGYSRSGSSIVSSLMDAHPHMVVAYQYRVIGNWNQNLSSRAYLYGELYEKSRQDATTGWRSKQNTAKSYTLHIDTGWQGRYDEYISVIGDKTAANTVGVFLRSKSHFSEVYTQLKETVGPEVSVKAVFNVRNPYDIISTRVLYLNPEGVHDILHRNSTDEDNSVNSEIPATAFKLYMKKIKESGDEQAYEDAKFRVADLKGPIRRVAREAKAISGMIDLVGSENVWQVHNMDLVNNPKATLMEMCEFFNVYCSADYVETCADSIFKSISKTRELVYWPQTAKQSVIDNVINAFPFFNRYTYEGD